jgi:hypothetical protein
MKRTFYRQCTLQRTSTTQVSWIPEPFCELGKTLKLRDDDGLWTDGWKVVTVGPKRISEDQLPDSHNDIKWHRKRTGDAMKKERKE